MHHLIQKFTQKFFKKDIDNFKVGDFIKVYQKIKEDKKEKELIHEGLVIAKKHGKGINATFTIRSIYDGVGVEKIFPLHLPSISKIEVLKRAQRAKKAKLYWVREKTEKEIKKRLKLK